jgi:small-conductance mechanosensitive channel/CRP-like cAMP-binding protein
MGQVEQDWGGALDFWNQVQRAGGLGQYYPALLLAEITFAFLLASARPVVRTRLRIGVILLLFSLLCVLVATVTAYAAPGAQQSALGTLLRLLSNLFFTLGSLQVCATTLFGFVLPPLRLEPAPILRDTLLGLGYIATLLYVLNQQGVNLSGIVATSAVLTGVIGFSLQDTLGNVMGGVSLQLDRSIARGDTIRVGTIEGIVRETGWRQTSIETSDWDTVLIPNSVLTKSSVIVLGRSAARAVRLHRVSIPFAVSLDHNPDDVIRTVERALLGHAIGNVATSPAPNCILTKLQQDTGVYALRYGIFNTLDTGSTNSQIHRRLVGALQRAGIRLAAPPQDIVILPPPAEDAPVPPKELEARLAAIAAQPMLTPLTEEERHSVAAALTKARFTQGDIVNYQGEQADYLYILAKGEAEVRVIDSDGSAKRVATLRRGDMFGEMGMMTGQPRAATVAASTELVCFRLDKDAFQATLTRRPEIAEAISLLLAERRVELDGVASGGGDQTARVTQTQSELLTRIKAFFLLT